MINLLIKVIKCNLNSVLNSPLEIDPGYLLRLFSLSYFPGCTKYHCHNFLLLNLSSFLKFVISNIFLLPHFPIMVVYYYIYYKTIVFDSFKERHFVNSG